MSSMETAFYFDELVPAGKTTCNTQRAHSSLSTGGNEPYHIYAGVHPCYPFGELDLQFGGSAVQPALIKLFDDGLLYFLVGMSQYLWAVCKAEIYILIAISVGYL